MNDPENVMVELLWSHELPGEPWYTAYNRKRSYHPDDRTLIGVAVRPKYASIDGSTDIDEFMAMVEDAALSARWFASGIDGDEIEAVAEVVEGGS